MACALVGAVLRYHDDERRPRHGERAEAFETWLDDRPTFAVVTGLRFRLGVWQCSVCSRGFAGVAPRDPPGLLAMVPIPPTCAECWERRCP